MATKLARVNSGHYRGATYSGTDMVVFFAFPGIKPIEVGSISTLSYSVYREKKQVRTIGRISAKGITKGARTISGRMIFTVMHEHIVQTLRKEVEFMQINKNMTMDELPSFDIIVVLGNEYGKSAGLAIQGVTTVDEQKSLSIEELFTENIFSFLARRLEPMNDTSGLLNGKWAGFDKDNEFRDWSSELLGKFKVGDLILEDYAKVLKDYDPFLEPPKNWDSVYPDIDTSPMELPDYSGHGEPDKDKDDDKDKKDTPKFTIMTRNHDAAKTRLAGVSISIVGTKLKGTTNGEGELDLTRSSRDKQTIKVKASKKGYKTVTKTFDVPKMPKDISRYADDDMYQQIVMDKTVDNDSLLKCRKGRYGNYIGEIRPYGYWYERGATNSLMPLYDKKGKKVYYPDLSFSMITFCGEKVKGRRYRVLWSIKNWDDVKKNRSWGYNKATVKTQSGVFVEEGFGDKNGNVTLKNLDFTRFPQKAAVTVLVQPDEAYGPPHYSIKDGEWYLWCDTKKTLLEKMAKSIKDWFKK